MNFVGIGLSLEFESAEGIFHLMDKLRMEIQNRSRTRGLLLPRLLSGQVDLKMEEADP